MLRINRIVPILTICLCLGFVMLFPCTAQAAAKTPAKPVIMSLAVGGNTVEIYWKKARYAKEYKVFMQTGEDSLKYWKKVKATSKNKKKYSKSLKYVLIKSGKKYKVYKRTNPYVLMGKTSELKYTYTGEYNTLYCFVVQAVNGKKVSKFSDPLEGVTEESVTHTVTFKNGVTGETIATAEVKDQETVQFPEAPEVVGHQFVGWDADQSTIITEDLTITANYKINQYMVRFVNGATGDTIAASTVDYGGSIDVPTPPVMEKKRFKSWSDPQADSGVIRNVTDHMTITANYVNLYTVTLIDEVTGEAFDQIEVEEYTSLTPPTPPNHYNDPERPFRFSSWSPTDGFERIWKDTTITAKYEMVFILNWVDSFDGSIIKTEKLTRPAFGTPPDYPSHEYNGQTITSTEFVGYDDTSGESSSNYKNITDLSCDVYGMHHIVTMYFLYPECSHKVRVVNANNSVDCARTFYVFDGADATDELYKSIRHIEGYESITFTDEENHPITTLSNVTGDRTIYFHFSL